MYGRVTTLPLLHSYSLLIQCPGLFCGYTVLSLLFTYRLVGEYFVKYLCYTLESDAITSSKRKEPFFLSLVSFGLSSLFNTTNIFVGENAGAAVWRGACQDFR